MTSELAKLVLSLLTIHTQGWERREKKDNKKQINLDNTVAVI
jgi:hypothetical protein